VPLIDALSAARFNTYLTWVGNDQEMALRLYTYNTQLCAALSGPLHMLEITLRNTADRRMAATHGPGWLTGGAAGLTPYQVDAIDKAGQTITRQGKQVAHDPLVAELNFGFWASLFSHASHHQWQNLRSVFVTQGLQRRTIAQHLTDLRNLRNRMAHHEPIVALPLAARYQTILQLTGWMEPEAETWINRHSTWLAAYAGHDALVAAPVNGRLSLNPAITILLPQVV
jgi:hypothetical protein